MDVLTEFWTEKYLKEYIKEGGSKIKFVTGRPGSGKTYLLGELADCARKLNYKVVTFSAQQIWLHDFKEIYLEILRQCDLIEALGRCAGKVAEHMGYVSDAIPEGMNFMDYLSSQDLGDAITRRELRLQLKEMFLDNPLFDNNFALACSLLTGGILGHPVLESQNQELLLAWLHGDKTVKLSLLRSLGLSPSRITRYNARHMLRSLVEVLHLGGYSGVVVLVVYQNESFQYAGSLIYIMAMYAFYTTVMAIVNLVRYRQFQSPVMSAARTVNLVAAMVSMLSLETAMLSQFGGGEDFRRMMTGATGWSVCAAVVGMGAFMMIHSSRQLKKMKSSHSETD